jgi:hypothetical protein
MAAKLAFNATTYTEAEPASRPWAQDTMEFVAWNGEKWTAWIRDDAFEQRPQNEVKWSRHSNPSLAFIDWEGREWQAKIDGDEFLLAHRGNWKGAIEHVTALRYRDWEGERRLRTVAQLKR